MRSHPADFQLIAPGSLSAIVSLLANEPGAWLPIAGGTDLMVLYAAGKLSSRKLISLWNLPELRRIAINPAEIQIGAACTYSDISNHEIVQREFPLLHIAARWTGGVANQNRGTLGGNIVNASPAADSLPALLAYDAELVLISIRGERRLPYSEFHTGYKKTSLAPDELVQSICLPRIFAEYISYSRKAGARNAQAISKVSIAALARVAHNTIEDVRIALGSVAPTPVRLTKTEQMLRGKTIDRELIDSNLLFLVRNSVTAEIQPIDDIRSTAKYRSVVAGNLVVEFLHRLATEAAPDHSIAAADSVLAPWNHLPEKEALQSILPCCGSVAWAQAMAARRPIPDETSLLAASNEIWNNLSHSDWMQAFNSHPRIGESRAPNPPNQHPSSQRAADWSDLEQRDASASDATVKLALADANQEYERRFNRIFIVCATGKSAPEILDTLHRRLSNDSETEIREAAEQQRQITELRLKKWLQSVINE